MATDNVIEYDEKVPGKFLIMDPKDFTRRLVLVRRQVAKTKGEHLSRAFRGRDVELHGHAYSGEEIRVYNGLIADEEAQTAPFSVAVAEGTAIGTLVIPAGSAANFP